MYRMRGSYIKTMSYWHAAFSFSQPFVFERITYRRPNIDQQIEWSDVYIDINCWVCLACSDYTCFDTGLHEQNAVGKLVGFGVWSNNQ